MPPLPPLPPLPPHTVAIVGCLCGAVALLDFFISRHLRKSATMSRSTLGDDFAAYLNADSALNVTKAQLQAAQKGLADATETFHQDLTTSGVKALLAPSTTPTGDTPVALVADDGSITIIVAANPNTPVGPVPVPVPTPPPAPTPPPIPSPAG